MPYTLRKDLIEQELSIPSVNTNEYYTEHDLAKFVFISSVDEETYEDSEDGSIVKFRAPEGHSVFLYNIDLDWVDTPTLYYRFDDWADEFGLVSNHIDPNASFDGDMFETYGDEVVYVCDRSNAPDTENTVWTYIDGLDGTYVINGYHYVNRIGYFITKKPAKENTNYEILVDNYETEKEEDDWSC